MIFNGTVTVESPKGGHRTFKIHTAKEGTKLAGKRIVSMMTGSDNESSFTAFAFADQDACQGNGAFYIWRRFIEGTPDSRTLFDGYHWPVEGNGWQKTLAIFADLMIRPDVGYFSGEGYRMLVERRCRRCNQKLTTPESVKAGIGPVCAKEETAAPR